MYMESWFVCVSSLCMLFLSGIQTGGSKEASIIPQSDLETQDTPAGGLLFSH